MLEDTFDLYYMGYILGRPSTTTEMCQLIRSLDCSTHYRRNLIMQGIHAVWREDYTLENDFWLAEKALELYKYQKREEEMEEINEMMGPN